MTIYSLRFALWLSSIVSRKCCSSTDDIEEPTFHRRTYYTVFCFKCNEKKRLVRDFLAGKQSMAANALTS